MFVLKFLYFDFLVKIHLFYVTPSICKFKEFFVYCIEQWMYCFKTLNA